jgi:hypothetical protein
VRLRIGYLGCSVVLNICPTILQYIGFYICITYPFRGRRVFVYNVEAVSSYLSSKLHEVMMASRSPVSRLIPQLEALIPSGPLSELDIHSLHTRCEKHPEEIAELESDPSNTAKYTAIALKEVERVRASVGKHLSMDSGLYTVARQDILTSI